MPSAEQPVGEDGECDGCDDCSHKTNYLPRFVWSDITAYLHEDSKQNHTHNRCYHNMITAWYYTLIKPDSDKMFYFANKAKDIAFKVFPTDVEIIDIIYIPTANCLFFLNCLKNAGELLEYAIDICRNHPDELRYIDKLIDLKIFQLDVFIELQDSEKCRKLSEEIDRMNDTYRDQGIFREISPETKEKLNELLQKT